MTSRGTSKFPDMDFNGFEGVASAPEVERVLFTPVGTRFDGVDCTLETRIRSWGAFDAFNASMLAVCKGCLLGTLSVSAKPGLEVTLALMSLCLKGPLVGVCSTVGTKRFLCVGSLSRTTSAIGFMAETGTCAQPEDGISSRPAGNTFAFCSCKVWLAKTFFRRLAAGVDII